MNNINFQIPRRAAAVTPSDDDITGTVAFRVGTAGDVTVETEYGDTVTIPDVLAGETVVLRVSKILAATTASGIVRFFNA